MPEAQHQDSHQDVDFDAVLSGQIASFDNMFDGTTHHAANAIDFSDEEELAEEENEDEEDVKDGVKLKTQNSELDDIFGIGHDDNDEEEEDDFMKELEQEAMEGVEPDGSTGAMSEAVFGMNLPTNTALHDLDFASNSILDATKQIGDSDIELSDDDGMGEYSQSKLKGMSEEETKLLLEEKKREQEEIETKKRELVLKVFFPSFKKGEILDFQELFPIVPLDFSYQRPPPVTKPLLPKSIHFEVAYDQAEEFKMSAKQRKEQIKLNGKKAINSLPDVKVVKIEKSDIPKPADDKPQAKRYFKPIEYDTDLVISTAEWNDDHIFEASENINILPPKKRLKIENSVLDAWIDDDDMIFEGNLDLELINLKLDMNDPNLIFMDRSKSLVPKSKHINSNAKIPTTQKQLELKYNVSNDKEYEILKTHYQAKVRATIGTLNIEHAPPALRLQSPFFKVVPTAKENRTYHRPKFGVKTNVKIHFSKPKTRKKKKDKGKEVSELFSNSNDLTLGDTAPFFLTEYSEEIPLSLNKFGMGSKIINYYRKRSEDDNTRPKLSVGETHILGVQDRSPFWNFGFVEKGSIVPTLYNKLVRAPLFHHESYSTDFLLVKSTGGGSGQRYFLRSLNHILTVGQTLPAMEVPGPHSRRATAMTKNRLKMIAYRALNANEQHRITVKDISEHFPKQSDMQIRQRLKEFMEYQRGGPDQGYWRLKNADKLPNYEQIRKMMSPEDACLLEVMMWGQQKFEDIDMFRRERLEPADDKDKKDEDETLRQQLAPWNTTRNFIQATQGKAMLQVQGDDLNGESISFLKISMKGGFLKTADGRDSKSETPAGGTPASNTNVPHTYNVAAQQKLYDEQIKKTWYNQIQHLSKFRTNDKPRIVELNELTDREQLNKANRVVDEEVNEKPRYLKITRMVKNAYGIKERKVQVIKDPKVVELYVKKKQEQLLESSANGDPNSIVITNDEEENMKVKKKLEQELAKLQKQAEKKKKKQTGITAANIDSEGRISGKGIGKGKSTSRRCATCGSLGHIRTNKTCPLYYTIHNKSNPNYIPGSEKQVEVLKQQGFATPIPAPKKPSVDPASILKNIQSSEAATESTG